MNLNSAIAGLLANMENDRILRVIPLLSKEISQADTVLLYRFQDNKSLQCISSTGTTDTLIRFYQPEKTHACGAMGKNAHVIIMPDAYAVEEPSTAHDREVALQYGFRSALTFPLWGKTGQWGLMIFLFRATPEFLSDEINQLQQWCQYCVLALESTFQKASVQGTSLFPGQDNVGQTELLAASISHELNNRLEGLKNYIHLLKNNTPAEHPNQQYIQVLDDELKKAGEMINQLAGLYHPEELPTESINIEQMVRELAPLMENRLDGKTLKLDYEFPSAFPCIEGVSGQLQSAFLNLMLNALQAMPNGGSIVIRGEIDPGNQNQIFIHVDDSGPGIPREIRSKIFKPFFTTKEKGTGLGLTIVKQIVKSHKGQINLDTSPEGGTRFTLSLPVHRQRSGEGEPDVSKR